MNTKGRNGDGRRRRRSASDEALDRLASERDRLIEEGRLGELGSLIERALGSFPAGMALESFLFDSIALVGLYPEDSPTQEWISAYERRLRDEAGPTTPSRAEAVRALRCYAYLVQGDWREATRIRADIRWALLEDAPWTVNLQLTWKQLEGDLEGALELLRSSQARYRTPSDLGTRLRILAEFYVDLGQYGRFLRLCDAALRHFRRDDGLRSRLSEVYLRTRLGRVHVNNGQLEEACRELESVVRHPMVRQFPRSLYLCAPELAFAYAGLGRYQEARGLLAPLVAESPVNARHSFEVVRVHQVLAENAYEQGDPGEAGDHLQSAQDLLDRFPDRRMQAYVDCLRGRIEAAEGRPSSCIRALAYLDRAEDVFRSLGTRGLHGLVKTVVTRGHVHLRQKEVDRALECCVESLELAGKYRFLPQRARVLLLQSYLLVEADLPAADKIYEEVLRNLGLIHNPVVLFRVIANLYMYTWKLEDGFDLTVSHLEQIHRLREVLDRDVFSALYEEHVMRKVLRRYADYMGMGDLDGD